MESGTSHPVSSNLVEPKVVITRSIRLKGEEKDQNN